MRAKKDIKARLPLLLLSFPLSITTSSHTHKSQVNPTHKTTNKQPTHFNKFSTTKMKTTLITLATLFALTQAVAVPGDASILATKKWQAADGCQTDWAGHCNAQCIGEAEQKKYKCKNIDSDITGSGCVVGWSTCQCTCFY